MKRVLIILGPAGSGKSTIGKQVAAVIGAEYISSGDIVRKLPDACTDLMDGKLYHNDSFIMGEILRCIHTSNKEVCIIDGIPRDDGQIIWISQHMGDINWKMVYIDASIEERFKRLVARKRDVYDTEGIIMKRLTEDNTTMDSIRFKCFEKFGSAKISYIISEDTGNTTEEVNFILTLLRDMGQEKM